MQDKREEILISKGVLKSEDGFLKTYVPQVHKENIKEAMDEYAKQMSLEFIGYVLKNMQGHSVDASGNIEVKYKGEWITAEQLFENFL